jgi:hypothetical protein
VHAVRLQVTADVRINPPDRLSENPNWVAVMAWQGKLANDRGQIVDNLDKIGAGHYVSTKSIPVAGDWNSLLRVRRRNLTAVPIYLAGDPGIGAEQSPPRRGSPAHSSLRSTILQRGRSPDIPQSLWLIGCLTSWPAR